MKIKFTIPGEPTGKARPRVTKWGAHTPEKTVLYENLIKTCFDKEGGKILTGELSILVTAYYAIPKSAPKKKRDAMLSRKIRPTKKPDCDNVLKIVADALNKIAYDDDSQIVSATVEKYYSNAPRVSVTVWEIEAEGAE